MARFDRSFWSAIGVAEPHDVIADISGEVIRILYRQGEDVALRGDVGAHRTLHFGELFARLRHMESGQYADVQVVQALAYALGTATNVAQGVFQQALAHGAEQDHTIADFTCQLQRLGSTGGDIDGHFFLQVDPFASQIEESNHPSP